MIENITIIVEKLNYKFELSEDRHLLVKRDADVDSIISVVDKDIAFFCWSTMILKSKIIYREKMKY